MAERQFPKPIPVNLPFDEPMNLTPEVARQVDYRGWLEVALVNAGAEVTGAGYGVGGADLDIMVDGENFNVRIKKI